VCTSPRRSESSITVLNDGLMRWPYIRTRLTDVTQQQVCSFSCITPMELKRQLAVIEPALSIVKISTSNNSVTYDTLIQHYKGNPEDNVPMAEVMSILNKKNIDAMTTAAQCAIFYWVRSHVLGVSNVILSVSLPLTSYSYRTRMSKHYARPSGYHRRIG